MSKIVLNYLYNMLYQFSMVISPVILTPYVARVLNVDSIGKYNYAFAIVSVLLVLGQLGTNMYGQREIAFSKGDKQERTEVFWNIFIIRIITHILLLPIYYVCVLHQQHCAPILYIMLIYVVSSMVDLGWFYQGIEAFRIITVRNIGIKILGIVFVLYCVKSDDDLLLYTFILAASQFIGNIYLWQKMPLYISKINVKKLDIKKDFINTLKIFVPTIAVYVYTFLDKILIGILSNDLEVAYYTQAEKLVKMLMTVITSLGIVLLPRLSAELKDGKVSILKDKFKVIIAFVFGVGTPMLFGCLGVSEDFIPWFLGNRFQESILIFQILSPLIIIIGLASVAGQAILIPLRLERVYTISILAGAVLNLIFNFILIPNHGALGAAIATIIAEFMVTMIQICVVFKLLNVKLKLFYSLIKNYLFGSVVVFAMCEIIKNFNIAAAEKIALSIIISITTYTIMLYKLRDKYTLLLKDYITNKRTQ